jgi:hypothetical protein
MTTVPLSRAQLQSHPWAHHPQIFACYLRDRSVCGCHLLLHRTPVEVGSRMMEIRAPGFCHGILGVQIRTVHLGMGGSISPVGGQPEYRPDSKQSIVSSGRKG